MSPLIYILPLSGFLLMPPVLLSIRFVRHSAMPWWLYLLMVSLFGWLLVNITVQTYYDYLENRITSDPNSSPELQQQLSDDGAKRVFALYVGWLYGLFYSVPWLLVYLFAVGFRSAIKRIRQQKMMSGSAEAP